MPHHKKHHHRQHKKRRHHKQKSPTLNRLIRKHPLVSGISAFVISIILLRISASNELFGTNVTEFRIWFIGFAILLGIIGLFAIYVWFKNNVADFFFKGNIKVK